jgi:SAM-dependent methyltransferase
MGARFERHKPRHWLASVAYKLNQFIPLSTERKLDVLLDLEWISWRLAHENAAKLGLHRVGRNDFLLDRIEPQQRVLDLGCGHGDITAAIAERGAEVVGIDHSATNLAIARQAHPDVNYVEADAREYLASGEKFDVLIMSHILEHLDRPDELLEFAAANFNLIYIEVPDFEASVLNPVRQKRGRTLIYSDNDHVAEFDRREMDELIEGAGIEIVEREFAVGVMRIWARPKG